MQLSQFLKVPIIYFFEDYKEFKDISSGEDVNDDLNYSFLSRTFSSLSKVQKENAVALQIEALCQNFPIVLGISLALGLPEVAVYGVIYYLTSMVIVVSYSFIEKF